MNLEEVLIEYGEEYTCFLCHKDFRADKTSAEQEAEARQLFSPDELEDCVVICDDCWRRITYR